ncbi:hypothetical protein E2C01_025672 [Portunus trituberculatus]|uniref:Uncharacterized protein n=1 Tax=Portunus trituberculatus TaxID=210409 RepID=A0A5B7EDZ3_PORTR|nr:hypothetical protein [Portunus trituberculatus]
MNEGCRHDNLVECAILYYASQHDTSEYSRLEDEELGAREQQGPGDSPSPLQSGKRTNMLERRKRSASTCVGASR